MMGFNGFLINIISPVFHNTTFLSFIVITKLLYTLTLV